jgi:non-specific serine/threonine protein kinase
VLGVTEQPDRSIPDALVAWLQGRQLVLLLDNCEHLVEACAQLADRLLSVCAGLRILATGREPLRLAGEVVYPVAPLALPDVGRLPADPDAVGRYPAVQLFVERARAVQPAFGLTTSNTAAVAQICVQLDGLPLALELAAARVRALTAEQIAARLDNMFRTLVAGSRTAPGRHQTMRATFDWSYDLLSPAEQRLFQRLAVFAGGWTLEAAEAVCSGDGIPPDEVVELLARLVDRSLLVAVETPAGSGAMRYRFLEPTRQYAVEQLQASGESAAAERRHTAYFMSLATAGEELWRGAWEMEWLERMDLEQDNLRAALRHTRDDPEMDAHLLLCIRHTRFWEVRGYLEEGQRWLSDAIALAEEAQAQAMLRMRAVGRATYLATHRGAFDQSGPLSQRWFALARELGDEAAAAEARDYIAYALWTQGALDDAASLIEESLAFFRMGDDKINLGANLMNLGWLQIERGNLERARELFDEVVPLARDGRDPVQEAVGLAGSGFLAHLDGDYQAAGRLARQALALLQEIGHRAYIGSALDLLGVLAAGAGQAPRAAQLFGASELVSEETQVQAKYGAIQSERERYVTAARLGPGAVSFADAWSAGRAMSLAQAMAYALADDEPAAPATVQPEQTMTPPKIGGLSPREREVVALVARGLSNREIATRLVITERTAGAHVEHILAKLGFATRTQIGVWAAEHGLVASGPS